MSSLNGFAIKNPFCLRCLAYKPSFSTYCVDCWRDRHMWMPIHPRKYMRNRRNSLETTNSSGSEEESNTSFLEIRKKEREIFRKLELRKRIKNKHYIQKLSSSDTSLSPDNPIHLKCRNCLLWPQDMMYYHSSAVYHTKFCFRCSLIKLQGSNICPVCGTTFLYMKGPRITRSLHKTK